MKKRKYWYQMNLVEWMWQEHKVMSVVLAGLTILALVMMILDLFYV